MYMYSVRTYIVHLVHLEVFTYLCSGHALGAVFNRMV